MWHEYKGSILFLVRFALCYIIPSVLYSFYLAHYNQREGFHGDPFTVEVAAETAGVLGWFGFDVEKEYPQDEKYVIIFLDGSQTISVYEGCNALNIMFLFVAFVVAYGAAGWKRKLGFALTGIVAIHVFNLARLTALALLTLTNMKAFHFYHKYGFTAVIYAFVILLWYLWVSKFDKKKRREDEGDLKLQIPNIE